MVEMPSVGCRFTLQQDGDPKNPPNANMTNASFQG